MGRLIIMALGIALSFSLLAGADTAPVTVTITQKTPIETLAQDGSVTGVSEATVGARMKLVSADGSQIILEDEHGTRYRMAQSSTDYQPPPVASSPATNNASPATAAAVVANPVVKPSPPANPSPSPSGNPLPGPPNNPSTAIPSQNQEQPLAAGPVFTVTLGDREKSGEMSVWPQGGVPDRPLLIVAHGHGGTGPHEIQGWLQIAKSHRFTIVCPTFLSSVNASFLKDDDPYFAACLSWIKDNVQYNKDWVFMTGFSGGGFPTWYLASKRPDFFHGLFFQSCNFAGNYYGLSLDRWFNKPLKLIWGSQDLPDIPVQNGQAVEILKTAGCQDYTTEIVPGGHHQEHQDMVVSWMEQNLAEPTSN
ncbi:MAG: hypothetical protein LV481_10220 [Methylacidiphilales bacterium]|nr:hypothetical protein [Candidatus Methylacidiphilales bacterium]